MTWLLDVTVGLWSIAIDLLGIFAVVKFKKGGPYGEGGRYMDNLTALITIVLVMLVSQFIVTPILRSSIESFSAGDQSILLALSIAAIVSVFYLIQRKRKH